MAKTSKIRAVPKQAPVTWQKPIITNNLDWKLPTKFTSHFKVTFIANWEKTQPFDSFYITEFEIGNDYELPSVQGWKRSSWRKFKLQKQKKQKQNQKTKKLSRRSIRGFVHAPVPAACVPISCNRIKTKLENFKPCNGWALQHRNKCMNTEHYM